MAEADEWDWSDFVGPTTREAFFKYGTIPEGLTPEEAKEEAKEILNSWKKLWPLVLIPIAKWFSDKKDKNENIMESIDTIAFVNFLTGYQDYIIAVAWILLARVNGTANKLSYVFVAAETFPP